MINKIVYGNISKGIKVKARGNKGNSLHCLHVISGLDSDSDSVLRDWDLMANYFPLFKLNKDARVSLKVQYIHGDIKTASLPSCY